jgi:DNA-binding response OmpR family regulator
LRLKEGKYEMMKPFAIIVEDDPKLGAIFQSTLHQAGFETFLDRDGTSFRAKLSVPNPALALLDLHPPFASGVDILQRLRSDRRWMYLPAILMTDDFDLAKSLQNKVEYILIKPVSVPRLDELARRILCEHIASQKTLPINLH